MTLAAATRRLLRSPLIDVMVGPHGIDRYLELVRPQLTVNEARAEVIDARRQTGRSVTLTLRTNGAWSGFQAGQFVRMGVEIDGIRRTRTYSPACSQHRSDGCLELTVTEHPGGQVSPYLQQLHVGAVVHLGAAQGEFVLPAVRQPRLVLISGGSGITPVLSMLRTLCDEGHPDEVAFLHYARTSDDWLYKSEVEQLASVHPGVRHGYIATREGGAHLQRPAISELLGGDLDPQITDVAVCGPPSLIDAVRTIWREAPDRVLTETFTPLSLSVDGEAAAEGTIRFLRSDHTTPVGDGTLLEQAEAAGLTPDYGCRMGICHTCTCRKAAGAVRNVLTGELSEEEDEDIQLCISVPAGDIALNL